MHKLTEVSLGGKLNLAPVSSNLERILDIGTGTGIWAMEMGGWVECIDLDLEWNSPDGSLTPEHASKYFNTTYLKASREGGMEPCPGPLLEGWLKDAGFKDVAAERHVWPVGTWPADKHLREVGAWNYLQIMEGLEAFTYALFTRVLDYSQQEVDVVCAKIRKEMRDPQMHAYFHMHVAYGRKLEDK
ncbi:MAG: hypothetical protein Q9161_004952 [Pseudevernia consocians]